MIILLSDGRQLRLSWKHNVNPKALKADCTEAEHQFAVSQSNALSALEELHHMQPYSIIGATTCYLHPHASVPLPMGIALCSNLDTFDKEKGRQVSLARALQAVFTKDTPDWKAHRLAVWTAYFNRSNPL